MSDSDEDAEEDALALEAQSDLGVEGLTSKGSEKESTPEQHSLSGRSVRRRRAAGSGLGQPVLACATNLARRGRSFNAEDDERLRGCGVRRGKASEGTIGGSLFACLRYGRAPRLVLTLDTDWVLIAKAMRLPLVTSKQVRVIQCVRAHLRTSAASCFLLASGRRLSG